MEEKALGPSPLRLATSPPQGDHVLVELFSSVVDRGLCGQSSPTYTDWTFLTGRHNLALTQVAGPQEVQVWQKTNCVETTVCYRFPHVLITPFLNSIF